MKKNYIKLKTMVPYLRKIEAIWRKTIKGYHPAKAYNKLILSPKFFLSY